MTLALDGRIAIITGAAGDLGFAMAERFLAAGARVALLDIPQAGLQARCTAAGLPADRIAVLDTDITSPESSKAAVDATVKRFGQLNILVNNAAAPSERIPTADVTIEDWRRTIDVNLTGAWLMAKWSIPHLLKTGGGVILNIASQLGYVTSPGGSAYSASKAGLHSLTRSIAVDYATTGLRCVSLSPGAVMTSRLTKRYGGEAAVNAKLAGKHPVGRLGRPSEIAEAALFLVSDGASFITGSDTLVDGGFTAV